MSDLDSEESILPFERNITGIDTSDFKSVFGDKAEYSEQFFMSNVWWWRDLDSYLKEKDETKVFDEKGSSLLIPEPLFELIDRSQVYDKLQETISYLFKVELAGRLKDCPFAWKPAWMHDYACAYIAKKDEFIGCGDLFVDVRRSDAYLSKCFKDYIVRKRIENGIVVKHANSGKKNRTKNKVKSIFNVLELIDRKYSLKEHILNAQMSNATKKLRGFQGLKQTIVKRDNVVTIPDENLSLDVPLK